MFVLKNAWATLTLHGWRTATITLTALSAATLTIFSTAVINSANTAETTTYQAQKPTVVIRPTAKTEAKRNGADSSWTKYHLSWEDYTTYVTKVQSAGVTFSYTFSETVPVRQTSSTKAIAGTNDAGADKTGGELTWRSFYTLEAAQSNDLGRFKLISGKHLNYTGADTSNVLISQSLAKKNNLKVGSTITVANPTNSSKTYKLKVRGIYVYVGSASKGQGSDAKQSKDNRENAIYSSYYTFGYNGLDISNGKGWAKPDLNVMFKLSKLKAYNTFVRAVKKAKLPSTHEVSSPSLTKYENKITPLSQLASRLRIVRIVTWAAGGVILLGLTILASTRRRGEIAVAMLVGSSRGRIAWQFMIESLMLTLLGLLLGTLLGGVGTPWLGYTLAGSNATPIQAWLIWSVLGYGLAICVALAIISMVPVLSLRRARLVDPLPVIEAPADDLPQSPEGDASESTDIVENTETPDKTDTMHTKEAAADTTSEEAHDE